MLVRDGVGAPTHCGGYLGGTMAEDVKPSHEGPRSGLVIHTHNFRGGLTIALLALVLLLSTFIVSSPTVPRILAIVVAIVGVGVGAGVVPIRGPQDFYGGLVLVLLAILALVSSADLPGQRGFAFGPGTAPRLFAGLLAAVGAGVTLVGVFSDGPVIEKYKIRGPALVVLAIFLFAALIRPFGLVIATYMAFLVSIMGSKEKRWLESLIAAAVMTAFCWLLFVVLLSLPFQLWPQSNGPEILFHQFEDIFTQTWIILQKLVPIRL
jgi:putative tricarboxylic transport membrane protein